MSKKDHPTLFDLDEDWMAEWQGMPEFVQKNKESIKAVAVHFEKPEDLVEFSKLLGVNITMQTKGFFFPIKTNKKKKIYVDES